VRRQAEKNEKRRRKGRRQRLRSRDDSNSRGSQKHGLFSRRAVNLVPTDTLLSVPNNAASMSKQTLEFASPLPRWPLASSSRHETRVRVRVRFHLQQMLAQCCTMGSQNFSLRAHTSSIISRKPFHARGPTYRWRAAGLKRRWSRRCHVQQASEWGWVPDLEGEGRQRSEDGPRTIPEP